MLVRIWMLLLAVALATSASTAPDLPTAETVAIVDVAFEDALIETAAPAPLPAGSVVRPIATDHELPVAPPPASIFRPPRLLG